MASDNETKTIDEQLEDDQVTLESQQQAEAEEAPSAEHSAQELEAKIAALEAELAVANERVMRASAEAQNARRRAEQDVEKAHKFGAEKIIKDMLTVVDNLERAVEAASAEGAEMSSVVEGVNLTLKSLVDALTRHNVETIDPEGEPFNPELHQAMSMVPQPDVEPNTVINVFQRGYTLNGRLMRPAMVVVSKSIG